MPEPPVVPRRPDRQPDYFDRLLARYAAVGNAGAGGAGAANVGQARPRLPGPFERAEARWYEAAQPEDPTSQVSPPGPYLTREPGGQPPAGQIRVERRTEIRTGPPGGPVPDPAPSASPRWITQPTPAERPTAWPRPDRPAVHRATSDASAASPGAIRPARAEPTAARGAPPASPAPAVWAVPRGERSAAAQRSTARPAAPRRRTRSAEPAVHDRIGRLEVRAAGADRAPTRTPRAGRRAPAVSLSDYLSAPGAPTGRGVRE